MAENADFSTWSLGRLISQQRHLEQILLLSAGQDDPLKPKMRAELRAVCAEIAGRPGNRVTGGNSSR